MFLLLQSKKNITVIIVLAALILHTTMIFFPPVNLEFAFVDAANYFNTPNNPFLLDQYFNYQANTLGLSYLAAQLGRFFSGVDLLFVIRMMNLCGIIFLAAGISRICTYLHLNYTNFILALVLFNPIVWAFSGRATTDFLPMALGVFAISLALDNKRVMVNIVLAGFILGIAAILKYHVLSLLIFLFVLIFQQKSLADSLIKSAMVATISIVMVVLYMVKMHALFGFWVTPPKFQVIHQLGFFEVFNNFILYTGFLGLSALPTFMISCRFRDMAKKYWKFILPALLVLFFVGMCGLHDSGELNFGPLDQIMGPLLRTTILSLASVSTLMLIFMPHEKLMTQDKTKNLLGIALIIAILVFSTTRPAQRYLLFLLPIFLFSVSSAVITARFTFVSILLLFIVGNTFIEYSRWSTGTAAKILVSKIQDKNLLMLTDPGPIEGHVGNYFYAFNQMPKQYIVVAGESPDALVTGKGGFNFLQKSFSVVPLKNKINSPL